MRFETGVSSRLWSSNTLTTLSNATPAMLIDATSNVGIQTSNPATALDVNGTGRFVVASSLATYTSSISSIYTLTRFLNLMDGLLGSNQQLEVRSTILYFSSFIVAGTSAAVVQSITF